LIPPALPSIEIALSGVKLLVAEDDMRTVYALSALLTSKGAAVLVADTGHEAWHCSTRTGRARGADGHHDAEMDGYEATRRLRRESTVPNATGDRPHRKGNEGRARALLEAGASDYLTKPLDSENLLKTLAQWLPGGAHAGAR